MRQQTIWDALLHRLQVEVPARGPRGPCRPDGRDGADRADGPDGPHGDDRAHGADGADRRRRSSRRGGADCPAFFAPSPGRAAGRAYGRAGHAARPAGEGTGREEAAFTGGQRRAAPKGLFPVEMEGWIMKGKGIPKGGPYGVRRVAAQGRMGERWARGNFLQDNCPQKPKKA